MNEKLSSRQKAVGIIVLVALCSLLAYNLGYQRGWENFLDGASISYCDSDGEYCYIDASDGYEHEIQCSKLDKCLTQIRRPLNIEAQRYLDDIDNRDNPIIENPNN